MIHFNNYPPSRPGDVELTEGAKKIMEARKPFLAEGKRDAVFEAYGEAVGHVVIAALDNSLKDNALHNGFRLVAPVIEDVASIAGDDASRAFLSGFETARGCELENMEATV